MAGQFFDGKVWWILVSDNKPGLFGKLNVTVYKVESKRRKATKGFSMNLPGKVSRVVGLATASSGFADILVEEMTSLNDIRLKIKDFAKVMGQPLILNMGGAARVSFLQLQEASRGKQVRSVVVYRWKKSGKSRKVVLKDYSGKAIGTHGGPFRIVTAQGTKHNNVVFCVEQDIPTVRHRQHTIVLLNRRLTVRAIIPLHEIHPYKDVVRPIVAFDDDHIAWYRRGSGNINVVTYKGDKRWAPATLKPHVPTKARPIIIRQGKLLFGGRNGQKQKRMKWPKRPGAITVSPNGQIGAALLHGDKGRVLQLYDPDQKLIREVLIPNQDCVAKISLANDGFAVVYLTGYIADSWRRRLVRPGQPQTKPKPLPAKPVILVAPDGGVTRLGVEGRLIKVFVIEGRQWVALHKVAKDLYKISLLHEKTIQWSVELPKHGIPGTAPAVWFGGTKEPRIGVQTRTSLRHYDLKGRIVEDRTIGIGKHKE